MTHEKRLIDANALQLKPDPVDNIMNGVLFIRGRCAGKTVAMVSEALKCMIDNAPTVDAIVPPVKIGQILWCILPHSDTPFECRVYCISREERQGLVLDYFRCVVKGYFAKAFGFEDVGKTIFLTKTEALAKMDGGNEDGNS